MSSSSAALTVADRPSEQHDLRCPDPLGQVVRPREAQVWRADRGQHPTISTGPHSQVLEKLPNRRQVLDPAGSQPVLELGERTDNGDLQIIGPHAGREFHRDRGEHRPGLHRVTVDAERAQVLQVQQHMPTVSVVPDGDQTRVGRGDVSELHALQLRLIGVHRPDAGVGGAAERRRQVVRLGQVQVELLGGQSRCPNDRQSLPGVGVTGRHVPQRQVDRLHAQRIPDKAQLLLDLGGRSGRQHQALPWLTPALRCLPPAGQQRTHRPFGWRLVRVWRFEVGHDGYALEQAVVRRLRDELHLAPGYLVARMPQGGATETVSAEDLPLADFCSLVDDTQRVLGLVVADEQPELSLF